MALTEYEKKILEQMEASLREEDPALASQMSAPVHEVEPELSRGSRAPRRIALGCGVAALGMVVLVAAVSLGYSALSIILGVVGFSLTVAGILYALSRPAVASPDKTQGAPRQRVRKNSGGWDSFIQDQERRWDDRKNDD